MRYKLIKKPKKFTRTKISASALFIVFFSAFVINCRTDALPDPRITDLTVNPMTVDVGESVNITWTIFGFFDIAVISYGDGNQTQMTMVQENQTYTILHEYENEGKYNISIYVANSATGYEDWDGQFITVQNNPPVFDISLDPSQADEDQLVNVSITNLQESDHDKEPGLLSYIYDFGNGNQTTSNSSSILHKWENGGTYPVTVTVIDDQGALNQKTQNIVIGNTAPDPDFTIGSEIPSTYGFYSDLVGAFPFGWTSIDKHYEATYSFENETDGTSGTDIGFVDIVTGSAEIISTFDGHDKIVKLDDVGSEQVAIINTLSSPQSYGTIEFWWCTDDTTKESTVRVRNGVTALHYFKIAQDKFQYYDGSWNDVGKNASNDRWYRIAIDFECTDGSYRGLSQYEWRAYIDGERYGDYSFSSNESEIDDVYFSTKTTESGYYQLIDAIGYSWDENYEIGDNEYAHESFDAFKVKEGADHHQKILEVKRGISSNDVEIYNSFESQPNGTVEFWFMHNNVSTTVPISTFSFRDSANDEEFALLVKNDQWYYRAGGSDTLLNIDHDPVNDTWYHVRVDFLTSGQYMGLSTNSFKVIIDQDESAQVGFSGDEITRLSITTDKGFSERRAYIDAIGYSWDPNYEVGNNFHIFIEEYYATFDFREEIVGTAPDDEDWHIPPPPSSKDGDFSIIDAGGDLGDPFDDPMNEIVEITDNSTSVSLIMEHNYTDQAYGSVEFWVRSNNTREKVWVFCLMQSDTLALSVLMDEDEWKYTINSIDYETINGAIGTPENSTWYHVRIDFRCNGADPYFSLQEGYFTVAVDSVLSSQYQMASVTSINRTRVTTGGIDTGVAYMDAIGYSWDPYYEIGDNRYPMVHYPEKSLIWFSASQTIDTESDEGSLSYYWDFGDGSIDFGKYVFHEYTTSGMYPVELTVMDDNGVKSSKTRIVLISNRYPNINFTTSQGEITVDEGTTVTFDTIVDDDSADVARMEYYWHLDGDEFNPYNVSEYTQGGWINSYTFTDDHDGTLYAMAYDPENAFDFDAINITVENVDPSVSIRRLDMIANVTFEVERNGPPWYDNNFTFVILGTDNFSLEWPSLYEELNFTGSTDPVKNVMNEDVVFNLLKDWKVYVNTTSQISGTVKYTITLDFQDGQQEELQSQPFSSGFAYWEPSLDSLWYDDTNFTIKHPVNVGVSMWDPSEDDLSLDLNYTVDMIVEIQCSDTLPISKSFDIDNTYFYDIEVYEQNGKKYANISAYTEVAVGDAFNDYEFPVCINNASYLIDPMIDLTELLVTNVEGPLLDDFSVVECISALNVLDALTTDDDGGSNLVDVDFDTQNEVDVSELCPDITLIHKDGGLMEQDITFYLDYYYSSNSSSDANMVFEPISTYTPFEEQTQSSSYGGQVTDSGSGGDSGYVDIHQSTDENDNLGSVLHDYGSIVNCDGSDSGSSYNTLTQYTDTYTNTGGPTSYSFTTGTYALYQTYTDEDPTDRSWGSSVHSVYHYPADPGNSWRYSGDWPGGFTTVSQNGFVIHERTRPTGYHAGWADFYYDGSGAGSYMYKSLGERTSGRVEFWGRQSGSDMIISFRDGGNHDICLQINSNGVYYYNNNQDGWWLWPDTWSWVSWGNGGGTIGDGEWYRVVINFQSDNKFDCLIYDETNTLRISKYDYTSETSGSVDSVYFYPETSSTTGGMGIDGYGETWNSGYTYDENAYPYQTVSQFVYNVPLDSMNVDNHNRAESLRFKLNWKIDYNTGKTRPTFRVHAQQSSGGFAQVWSTSSYTDNYWYNTWIEIDPQVYSVGDYDLDLYFYVNTGEGDPTAPFSLYVYDIDTEWKEYRYTNTDKYFYAEPNGNIPAETTPGYGKAVWELDVPAMSDFMRNYTTRVDYAIDFMLSQSKGTVYVQAYKFYNGAGWTTLDSGTFSGAVSIDSDDPGMPDLTKDYVYDAATNYMKFRIYTSGTGNPFELRMDDLDVDWHYSYEYYNRYEVPVSGLNEFRELKITNLDLDLDWGSSTTENVLTEVWDKTLNGGSGDWASFGTGSGTKHCDLDNGKYVDSNDKIQIRQTLQGPCEFSFDSIDHDYNYVYSYYDTYRMELPDMNDFRIDHITLCTVSYQIGTHDARTINVQAYKHTGTGTGWNTKDIASTPDNPGDAPFSNVDSGSFTVDKDYIYLDTGKYYIDIHYDITSSPTETIFETESPTGYLTTEWEYSYSWDDEFEISLTDMNDFRYDNFEDCTVSYTISTRSGKQVDVSLWDYGINDWVFQETVTAGSSYQDSVYISDKDYIHSSTYKMKIKFDDFTNTNFTLDDASVSWGYSYSYYDTSEVDLDEMTQFRYDYFDECTLDYIIDLPRAGKSTTVYLYNFTKSDWDYFKTTVGGGNDIQDSVTFNTIDYIDSSSNKTRIKFTGFTDTEFNKDSIVANYSREYDVQDKYYTVLSGMTPHKYDTFEKCNITYSLQTTEDQTLQVQLFNFTSSEWTSVGSPFNTIKDTEYNGSTLFTSDEFIHPTEYKTRIFFSGIQDSFLTLNSLENNYSQSLFYTYTDFGYDDQGMEGEPYADMVAIYRNVYMTNHIFDYAGEYVVTWNVSDGRYETQEGQLIEIIYQIPSLSIGDLPDIILEDQEVLLESNIGYSDSAKYQFFWEFGDGHFSVDRDPLHRWSESDNYMVTLHVRDLYGNYYNDSVVVEVEEKMPEIIGPITFYETEGQTVVLDIEVSDSLLDLRDLSYTWYDDNQQELTSLSNNRKPTIKLPDGEYIYSLLVEDSDNNQHQCNISIFIEDAPPSASIPSYMYHGDSSSGTLTLTAYGYDSTYDINNLEFSWKISFNGTDDTRGPYSNVNRSSIQFDATKTALYQGEVKVRDPVINKSTTVSFAIFSVIDSNGNGFSDEFEEKLAEEGENIYDYFDSDNDGLSDLYEINNNITDWTDPDTDNDGLYDGVDRTTGLGESTAGTDPADWDSDDDLLSDSIEVYGWEMESEMFGTIFVTSNPLESDTDGDGWDDKKEFDERTDPRSKDTDMDLLNDPDDPHPLKWDGDEDGLSDKIELDIGTDANKTDTDDDGLNDGDEVLGWAFVTDPLTADSDRDFMFDNTEVKSYEYELEDRVDLDQPVTVKFQRSFTKAASGQIEFSIAFGEANDSVLIEGEQTTYGILDVPDIEILITKDDMELFRGNTNKTRYYSQVVDIKAIMDENSANYYGNYHIRINDTDAGCILEQFKVAVVRYLDPNNNDLDGDGIMDGVELDLIVRGTNVIDIDDFHEYNNIMINEIYQQDENYNFKIETGEVDLTNTIDQSVSAHVSFEYNYVHPVVVAYVMTRNNGESVEVRVTNVTGEGCDIFIEEPDGGSHATETIGYIVTEEGEWHFPDGTEFKAGKVSTDQAHQGGNSYSNWEQVSFIKGFSTNPLLLHSLNTYNNEDFKTSIVSAISTSSFNITQESAESGTSTSGEVIGWIAIEAGKTGTIDNVKYETIKGNDGDADGVDDDGHTFSFTTFSQTPEVVVVSQDSANNVDGSWARSDGVLSASTHTTNAEEDQVGDSERNHPDEYFGLIAFEEELSYGYDYTPPQDPDFKVIRGTTIISSSSATATITEGTDYNLESGIDSSNCFIRITNTRITGMGKTAAGGSQNSDDFSAWIQNPDNIATFITFERAGTTNDNRIDWEILQYTGPSGGANEMIIRDVDTVTCGGASTATCDGATINDAISDSDKVVVFITGQKAVDTGRTDWYESLFTADLIDEGGNDYTPRFTRGKAVASDDGISYAVVEFTGSNWRDVQRLEVSSTCPTAWSSSNYDTAYSDVTIQSEGGVDLLDYTKTFIHQQYRTNNDETGLDDAGDNIEIISNTQFRLRNAATSNERYKVVWIIENTQTTGDVMSVQHEWHYDASGGSEEETYTDTFTDVSNMGTTSVFAHGSSDGGGTMAPRGSVNYRLTDTDTITFTHSDSGQPQVISYEVVEWPMASSGGNVESESEPEPFDTEMFYLDIPDRGIVYDANLTVTVVNTTTLEGYGTVTITLYKEDINCNIDDVVLIDYDIEFNKTAINFNQFIDLTDKINDETINQFYGSYRLEIVIFDSGYENDVFNVTQFFIETDTFVDALPSDTDAWITDPALWDTDGDSISDYNEIYGWTRGSETFYTNPVSKDSDGDGAKDTIDRHPTENVMIKISPLSATHRSQCFWEASPKLEIVISYELNGDDYNHRKIYSPKIRATEDLWRAYIFPFWYSHWRRTNFAANNVNYYVDIDDNPNIQPENMDFGFSLWHMEVADFFGAPLWDNWLAGGSVVYTIGDVGHSTTFDVSDVGPWGQDNELHVKVETISVNKSNTIAIYDKEDSLAFNGHYHIKERMNIIILDVNNDVPVSGTPFNYGPNAIVIPTNLFSQTKLNGYVQNEILNETALYSDVEGEFEFISIGRNGTTEEGSDEIDFVIYRFNINATAAMEILTMMITVIINETLELEEEIFGYWSTKENGSSAPLMNLHESVLRYLPWYCNFANSPQGDEPTDFFEFWAEVFIGAILAIGYFFYMIGMAIVDFFAQVVAVIAEVLMNVLSFLALLLWLIIRAVLLILFYITLAMEILGTILIVVPMGLILMVLAMFTGWVVNWGINVIVPYGKDTRIGHIHINSPDFNMKYESWIRWVYWDFFDIWVPYPDMDLDMGDIMEKVTEAEESNPTIECGFVQIEGTEKYDFHPVYKDVNGDPPSYIKVHLISPSGTESEYSMERHPDLDEDIDWDDPATSEAMYKSGVLYNKTIDFTSFEQGQWFYYFSANNTNVESGEQRFPTRIPYTIGPSLIEYKDYLSVPIYEGEAWENDITNFTVIGYEYEEGVYPDDVDLMLILPDGSFESIAMTNTSTFFVRDGTLEGTEFVASVNMSDYFDFNEESSYVGFFFNASLNDGNSSMIFGYDTATPDVYSSAINPLSEEDDDAYDGWTYVSYDHPFEMYIRSIEKDGDPQIVTYRIDELTGIEQNSYRYEGKQKSWLGIPMRPMRIEAHSEDFFRITAWVRDEAGTHVETWEQTPENFTFVPQVTLSRPGQVETLDMMWCGYDEELEADMYFVDLSGWGDYDYEWSVDPDTGEGSWNSTSFGPGVWDITFSVEDSQSNSGSLVAEHKLYHTGSITSFMNVWWGGYDQGMLFDKTTWWGQIFNFFTTARPIITFALFLGGGILEFVGTKFYPPAMIMSVIVHAVTVIVDFIGKFTSVQSFVDNRDAGGLMGSVFNMLMSMLFLTVSSSVLGLTSNPKSIGGGKTMSKATKYFFSALHIATCLNMVIALLSADPLTIFGATVVLLMSFVSSKLFKEGGPSKPFYKLATFILPFITMGIMWFGSTVLKPIFDMLDGALQPLQDFLSPVANIGSFILSGPFQFLTLFIEAMGIGIIFTAINRVRSSCSAGKYSPTKFGTLFYLLGEAFLMGYAIVQYMAITDAFRAMWLPEAIPS